MKTRKITVLVLIAMAVTICSCINPSQQSSSSSEGEEQGSVQLTTPEKDGQKVAEMILSAMFSKDEKASEEAIDVYDKYFQAYQKRGMDELVRFEEAARVN